jgi:hypothetical protein
MSDRDEKGRKTLEWQELKGPFDAMKATFGDGLQFHAYADNTLYLCRPAGPYDNVDLGAFQDPFAKAEEIAATLLAPVEPPVLSRADIRPFTDAVLAMLRSRIYEGTSYSDTETGVIMARIEELRDAILESLSQEAE